MCEKFAHFYKVTQQWKYGFLIPFKWIEYDHLRKETTQDGFDQFQYLCQIVCCEKLNKKRLKCIKIYMLRLPLAFTRIITMCDCFQRIPFTEPEPISHSLRVVRFSAFCYDFFLVMMRMRQVSLTIWYERIPKTF